MAPSPPSAALTDLLQSLAQPAPRPTVTPAQITLVAHSLLPTSPKSERSLAYICLTKLVEDASFLGAGRDAKLVSTLQPLIDVFQSTSDESAERYLPITALLTALFPLAPVVSSGLLLAPLSKEDEAPDAMEVLLEMAELDAPLQLALAELFVSAAGTKQGREMVQSRGMEWLQGATALRGDGRLSGVACAAIAKLRSDSTQLGLGAEDDPAELCEGMFGSLCTSLKSPSTVLAIVEGLSVLSLRPAIKHLVSNRPEWLKMLFGLLPTPSRSGSLPIRSGAGPHPSPAAAENYEPVDTSLCYGISTILVNLSSRRPVLSAEDQQMAKLRAMAEAGRAGAGPSSGSASDPLEETAAVQGRVGRLYQAGVVSALFGLARADSLLVRQMVGKLCLNLVEDKERRMEFIRDGGYKVLSEVTRKLMSANEGPESGTISVARPTEIDVLPCLQAGAKLIITTPPNLLFPPPHLTSSLNALTPLYTLLTHPKSSLLQTFEALMGLTNLASISPEIADRIVGASISLKGADETWMASGPSTSVSIRLVDKVEEMMMEENELVRRAATELVCNLAGCEKGFRYLSGESSDARRRGGGRAKQRLTILLILTDSEDLPTRLAAGGALAVLTESPEVCRTILSEAEIGGSGRSAWKRLTTLLGPEEVEEEGEKIALISSQGPDEGMVLRAGCILLNLLQYTTGLDGAEREREVARSKEDGVGEALRAVVGTVGEEVRGVIVECLEVLRGM